ncbi:MAG: hypothetical protein II897_04660 [Clostridia bacterium]|nr:hypothetical protein [Clostridia bacterium]
MKIDKRKKQIKLFRNGLSKLAASLLVAVISAAAFIGTAAAADSLARKAAKDYAGSESFDIMLTAPLDLTDEELELIRSVAGVAEARALNALAEDGSELPGRYSYALITVDGSRSNPLGSPYRARVNAAVRRLEDLSALRAEIRHTEVEEELDSRAEAIISDIEAARERVAELKTSLDSYAKQLPEAEADVSELEDQLKQTEEDLEAARSRLSEAESALIDMRANLDPDSAALENEKKALDNEEASLSQRRAALAARWNALENDKEAFRSTLRSAISDLGGEPEFIDWASKKSARPDHADTRARDLWVTSTYSFDLENSLSDNVKALIWSDEIPDEDILALTSSLGIYHGKEVETAKRMLAFGVGLAVSSYEAEHTRLRDAARLWDADHDDYTAALADYMERRADFTARIGENRSSEQEFLRKLAAYKSEFEAYERTRMRHGDIEEKLARKREEVDEISSGIERDAALKSVETARIRDLEAEYKINRNEAASIPDASWEVKDLRRSPSYGKTLAKYDLLRAVSVVFGCMAFLGAVLAGLCIYKDRMHGAL